MHQFMVHDMTCGHCASSITKAVKGYDAGAKVKILLSEHIVKVESKLSAQDIAHCITRAGYTPRPA